MIYISVILLCKWRANFFGQRFPNYQKNTPKSGVQIGNIKKICIEAKYFALVNAKYFAPPY